LTFFLSFFRFDVFRAGVERYRPRDRDYDRRSPPRDRRDYDRRDDRGRGRDDYDRRDDRGRGRGRDDYDRRDDRC
jgi:hypothetical protein